MAATVAFSFTTKAEFEILSWASPCCPMARLPLLCQVEPLPETFTIARDFGFVGPSGSSGSSGMSVFVS